MDMATREDLLAAERDRVVMATAGMPASVERFRVSWGGVWAGFLLSVGISILLGALGLAIGVTVADVGPGEAGSTARGLGIGAGIWAFLTLVVALFFGGMVAARAGAVIERSTAMTQGALVWVLTILATTYIAASGIGLGANELLRVTGGAAQQAMARSGGLLGDLTSGNVERLLARLNDPQTASTLSTATGMPQPEVQRILSDASARIQANRNDPPRALAEARSALKPITDRVAQQTSEAAAQAKPYATATGWATFITLVLSLVAAVSGALAGYRRLYARVP
jgi:hypothetical protein